VAVDAMAGPAMPATVAAAAATVRARPAARGGPPQVTPYPGADAGASPARVSFMWNLHFLVSSVHIRVP
jgi:hypothetical protein